MKEIRVPRESFDAEAFLVQTIEFLGQQMSPRVDPTYGIVRVESPGDVPSSVRSLAGRSEGFERGR